MAGNNLKVVAMLALVMFALPATRTMAIAQRTTSKDFSAQATFFSRDDCSEFSGSLIVGDNIVQEGQGNNISTSGGSLLSISYSNFCTGEGIGCGFCPEGIVLQPGEFAVDPNLKHAELNTVVFFSEGGGHSAGFDLSINLKWTATEGTLFKGTSKTVVVNSGVVTKTITRGISVDAGVSGSAIIEGVSFPFHSEFILEPESFGQISEGKTDVMVKTPGVN